MQVGGRLQPRRTVFLLRGIQVDQPPGQPVRKVAGVVLDDADLSVLDNQRADIVSGIQLSGDAAPEQLDSVAVHLDEELATVVRWLHGAAERQLQATRRLTGGADEAPILLPKSGERQPS
jgi:hypothetical protein